MIKKIKLKICCAFLLALCLGVSPVWAEYFPAAESAAAGFGDIPESGYLLWKKINQARVNPRVVLSRLGIAEDEALRALGDDAWMLDGLPPVALNGQLRAAALGHGRDMLEKLYYSYYSLSGFGPCERIAATGYEAVAEGEAMSALVFTNYIALDLALDTMLDTMLRDELTGVGDGRRIFSDVYTEMGISFMAGSVTFLAGQPYVYLIVADFAQPVDPRSFVVGVVGPGAGVGVKDFYTGFWELMEILPGSMFQIPLATGADKEVSLLDEYGAVRERVSISETGVNRYLNFAE